MASFAKLGLNSKVKEVVTVDDSIATTEKDGINFLIQLTNYPFWIQTYEDGSIRKNFAGIGYTYDEERDAFIRPQPYPSWTLNETTCLWEAPIARPELTQEQIDNKSIYTWNETNQTWDLVSE